MLDAKEKLTKQGECDLIFLEKFFLINTTLLVDNLGSFGESLLLQVHLLQASTRQ